MDSPAPASARPPPAQTGWAILLSQQNAGHDQLHEAVPTLGLWISGDLARAVESKVAALSLARALDQVFGELFEGVRLAASAMGVRTAYSGDAVSPGSPGAFDLRFCEIEGIDPIDGPQAQLILQSAALHLGSWAGVELFKASDFGRLDLPPSAVVPKPMATFLAWHEATGHLDLLRNVAFSALEACQLHGASVVAPVKPRRTL